MKKKNAKQPKKPEQTKALALTPEYKETIKFQRWCKAFLDPKSSTYGNATQSALQVYNTVDYNTAGVIGHDNLKKLKVVGKQIAENEGLNYKELMKIGMAKMMKESYDTWEKFMIRIGYFDPPTQAPTNQINFNIAEMITASRKERGLQ